MKKIQIHGIASKKYPLEYIGPIEKEDVILVVKEVEESEFLTKLKKDKDLCKKDAEKLIKLFENRLPQGTLSEFIKILYEDYGHFLSKPKK